MTADERNGETTDEAVEQPATQETPEAPAKEVAESERKDAEAEAAPAEAEAKPKRSRSRAKKAEAPEAEEQAGEAEEKPKRRRSRAKKAEPVAEEAGDVDAAAEAAEAEKTEAEEPEAEEPEAEQPEAEEADAEEPPAETPAPRRRAAAPRDGEVQVVRARAKYVRTSARKARLVSAHIRGKSVDEARAILDFAPRAVARDWKKLLESAVANAEHNHELVGDDLRVAEAYADEGPTLKRYRPRAMGRATRIRKRTSHLTITLTPKE